MLPATDVRGVLYRGGPILTVDPDRHEAEAVATRAGRIVAVGREIDCRRALELPDGADDPHDPDDPESDLLHAHGGDGPGSCPTIVELGGRALVPGFIDAHLHPMAMCFYAGRLDLGTVDTVADVLDALADEAQTTPPGEWVLGVHLTPDLLADRRMPTIDELDAIGDGRAVVVLCRDGHTAVGNTAALAAAGVRPNRADPPGGGFERDQSGRLTGVCWETATRMLLSVVPLPDLDQFRVKIEQVFAQLAADGITSTSFILQTDAEGPAGAAGELESVGMMIFIDDLPLGAHSILCGDPARAVDARASSTLHDPDRNHVVGGVKLFLDGTLSARTAYLRSPYTDAPSRRGWLTLDLATAAARMDAIHRAGLQICVHAIGDAAVGQALDLFTDLAARHAGGWGGGPRHQIIHASVLDQAAAERMAELCLTAVVQPPVLRTMAPFLCQRLGAHRAPQAYAFRTLADAGVVIAGSSSAPVEDTNVLAGITAAVTRWGFQPDQALTTAEAVEMYTRGGAVAQQREHLTGRIAEGLHADMVVLSDDPTAVPVDAIADIEVVLTVAQGRVVHRSASLPQ